MRGLKAPPRYSVAPAARTCRAMSRACFSDSTAHGPATTTTLAPPTATPPTDTTVSSRLASRETSL